jgi:two-component system chemotaxis response regulator CheY
MNSEKKVLIVDDFETMRRIVKSILKTLGFTNVDEAKDGVEALEKLRGDTFDLILSDCNMPEMDGLELLQTIKKESDLKAIPFVVMTASDQEEKMIEMAKAGMDDYIVKPFTNTALNEKLEALL